MKQFEYRIIIFLSAISGLMFCYLYWKYPLLSVMWLVLAILYATVTFLIFGMVIVEDEKNKKEDKEVGIKQRRLKDNSKRQGYYDE